MSTNISTKCNLGGRDGTIDIGIDTFFSYLQLNWGTSTISPTIMSPSGNFCSNRRKKLRRRSARTTKLCGNEKTVYVRNLFLKSVAKMAFVRPIIDSLWFPVIRRGQVPAEAELNFLKRACQLDTYGFDPYSVKARETDGD